MNALSFPVVRRFRLLVRLAWLAVFTSWLLAAVDLRDRGEAHHRLTPASPQLNAPFALEFEVENADDTIATGAEAVFYLSTDQVPGKGAGCDSSRHRPGF